MTRTSRDVIVMGQRGGSSPHLDARSYEEGAELLRRLIAPGNGPGGPNESSQA